MIVATRYHNIVCALRLGKPLVSLGYAEKNDVLMTEMGVGRFCQHIERLDLDLLIEQFTHCRATTRLRGRHPPRQPGLSGTPGPAGLHPGGTPFVRLIAR